MAKDKNDNTEQPKKQPGFLQMVIAGLLVFLLGGGLVIGYFNIMGLPGEKEEPEKVEEEELPTATLELGTIIVNLANPGGNRYLKCDIVLEYHDSEEFAQQNRGTNTTPG